MKDRAIAHESFRSSWTVPGISFSSCKAAVTVTSLARKHASFRKLLQSRLPFLTINLFVTPDVHLRKLWTASCSVCFAFDSVAPSLAAVKPHVCGVRFGMCCLVSKISSRAILVRRKGPTLSLLNTEQIMLRETRSPKTAALLLVCCRI